MDFKLLEEKMLTDEEFGKYLPILQKEYWDKARPKKRLEFLGKLQELVNSLDSRYPQDIIISDIKNDLDQTILVGTKAILMDKAYVFKKLNPYSVLSSYVFELALENNYNYLDEEESDYTEKGRRFRLNNSCSLFDNWTNFHDRRSSEFSYQPLTHEAYKDVYNVLYALMKYMYQNYGMDEYIEETLNRFMMSEFSKARKEKKVEENFKVMEKNYEIGEKENEIRERLFEFLDENDWSEIEDTELFALFNTKLINNFAVNIRLEFYKEFIRRILKGYDELEDFLSTIRLVETDSTSVLIIDGAGFKMDIYNELNVLLNFVVNIKVEEDLLDEIEDEEFRKETRECLQYLNVIKGDGNAVSARYLGTAYAYVECKNLLIERYHNMIKEAIKNSRFWNEGEPLVVRGDFSKYDAYLKFSFNKDYKEVRQIQLDDLKEEYIAKIGGKK